MLGAVIFPLKCVLMLKERYLSQAKSGFALRDLFFNKMCGEKIPNTL